MEKISAIKAPAVVGPYSHAIKSNNLVFTSGQIAVDPKTNELAGNTIEKQTVQVLENLKEVLKASGTSLEKALKVTVYLTDMNNYQKMNEIYAKYFTGKPARSTVQVGRLPRDVLVEIDVIAESG